MMFELLADLFSSIWPGFSQWLIAMTPFDFVLMFWPLIIVDAARSVGKSVVLLADWAERRIWRKRDATPVSP